MDDSARVVITGLGVISPNALSVESFAAALAAGTTGVTRTGASYLPESAVGAVNDFEGAIHEFADLPDAVRKSLKKALKVMNRETLLGLGAAQQAIAEAKIHAEDVDPERVGVCFGASNADIPPEEFWPAIQACQDQAGEFLSESWGTVGLSHLPPLWLLRCLPNMPACQIAMHNSFRGPNNTITQRESSANLAVAEAVRLIREQEADVMITGSTGTMLTPLHLLHNREAGNGETPPPYASRPFEIRRRGMIPAEGAGALVLESLQRARQRGATIYGEIVGYGSSCTGSLKTAAETLPALEYTLQSVLQRSGWKLSQVGHLHAHGLSSPKFDRLEARTLRKLLGKTAQPPLLAVKSATGNAGAGCGAIELVASVLALKSGLLYPVLNYEQPDPDCPVSPVTAATRQPHASFLNYNFSSNGSASCVLVQSLA